MCVGGVTQSNAFSTAGSCDQIPLVSGAPLLNVTVANTTLASVVNPFVRKLGLTFPVALDPKMAVRERYGVWAVPSTFIIDRAGKRVLFANGSREWDSKAAHALMESLLK